MDFLSFNKSEFTRNSSKIDPLSIFKPKTEQNQTIEEGMSIDEISDIVSKKVIAVIEKQFDETMKQQLAR